MSFFKTIFILFFVIFISVSCKNKNNATNHKTTITNNKLTANLKKSEFNISGMTCEIGCTRLIQSRLSKIDGVNYIKVNYKDSIAFIEFDTNKLTLKNIEQQVNKIAGGDLYKATTLKELSDFKKGK